jgi:PTH1 family peptidyl-tRNA hydrolase
MEKLHLIVGLGNPGADYTQTRHNAGFQVVERLARRWDVRWTYEKRFNARVARFNRGEHDALLCEPQTYMNSSGEALASVVSFYRASPSRLLVVVDDADLPVGELRLRPGGSSGGHHGLESIEQHLGTREYARLRVGIGRQDSARQIAGHVLSRFSSTETAIIDKVLTVAADQAECWLVAGIQKAMNQFNGPINGAATEGKEK